MHYTSEADSKLASILIHSFIHKRLNINPLPPQHERHNNQDDPEAAEDDANDHN